MTEPLRHSVALMPWRSSAAFRRRKTTRMPYSRHVQLGMSGTWACPPGGLSTVRAIGAAVSQFSIAISGHTTRRASPGSLSGGRSTIALYSIRSLGSTAVLPVIGDIGADGDHEPNGRRGQ